MLDLESAERLAFAEAVAAVTERDLLLVTGSDAVSYLHGQLSQDVEGLAVGASARTLLLQPQGKVDAWLRIHRRAPDELWLDVDAGYGDRARHRLERFKLRVDVDIEVVPAAGVLAVRGPGTADLVAGVAEASDVVALAADWAELPGADLLPVPPTGDLDVAALLTRLGADASILGPPETLDVIRVRLGLPAMGHELDESTIPAAARIVDRSVDFTKGCYVGQELVARVDSRGSNTPTRLHGFRAGTVPAAELGTELFDGDADPPDGATPAGTITTVVESPALGTIGLAYLKRTVEVPRSLRAATASGGSVPIEAMPLPLPG